MKYVFPCIISQNQGLYSLAFPDLDNRKVYCSDLYDLLKKAHNILLVELYIKESQRMVIANPTPVQKLELQEGETTSYVTCDTEAFENMLDLYDNIHTDDLEQYLQEKEEEAEAYETTIEADGTEETSPDTPSEDVDAESEADAEAPPDGDFMLDYEEEFEVKKQSIELAKEGIIEMLTGIGLELEPEAENTDAEKKKKASEVPHPKTEGNANRPKKKRPYNNYRPRKH